MMKIDILKPLERSNGKEHWGKIGKPEWKGLEYGKRKTMIN
jgi:hypothetical protein